jgi:hypothetical protein
VNWAPRRRCRPVPLSGITGSSRKRIAASLWFRSVQGAANTIESHAHNQENASERAGQGGRNDPIVNGAPQRRRSPVEEGPTHVVVGMTW